MSKIILVTGASSGFGKAIATKFAAGGWNVILTARRKEKLHELSKALESNYGIKTLSLIFDVQDKKAVFATKKGFFAQISLCCHKVLGQRTYKSW